MKPENQEELDDKLRGDAMIEARAEMEFEERYKAEIRERIRSVLSFFKGDKIKPLDKEGIYLLTHSIRHHLEFIEGFLTEAQFDEAQKELIEVLK